MIEIEYNLWYRSYEKNGILFMGDGDIISLNMGLELVVAIIKLIVKIHL